MLVGIVSAVVFDHNWPFKSNNSNEYVERLHSNFGFFPISSISFSFYTYSSAQLLSAGFLILNETTEHIHTAFFALRGLWYINISISWISLTNFVLTGLESGDETQATRCK